MVEKYNGTVSFTDKGDIFEVSAMLYGIEVKLSLIHISERQGQKKEFMRYQI